MQFSIKREKLIQLLVRVLLELDEEKEWQKS